MLSQKHPRIGSGQDYFLAIGICVEMIRYLCATPTFTMDLFHHCTKQNDLHCERKYYCTHIQTILNVICSLLGRFISVAL